MSLSDPLTFATGAGVLDRATHLRPEAAALLADARARLLPQWRERALIELSGPRPAPGWVVPTEALLAEAAEPPVLLGLYQGTPCFTADFPALGEDGAARFGEAVRFVDLRSIAGELAPEQAAILATAKGVIGWHRIHPFCARCGAPSVPEDAGWRRRCTSCGGMHFPRTDPVVIMLVTRGDAVLLGRQRVWPPGLYSLLAGFMEPGETIEDAVRRETMEETSVRVGRVRFIASQPWPFPASLMLGCWAEALSGEITVDPELEDALWLPRAEVAQMLAGAHPRLASPRRDAIARWILTAWVAGEIEEAAIP
ncbi:MAG TPA: NAD(+) diphosphatase [Thermohalobaculum sp.]|nr:NAD(+) diphosphatase [Thermohalobaculum sp.]